MQETYPSGRVVKNEFDDNGDLSRIYGNATSTATERTYVNSFTYTADGRIERLKLGNGLWENAKFNTRLQVTELSLGHGPAMGDLWKLGYEYGELQTNGTVDAAKNTGNIAKQTLSFNGLAQPFVQTYKYDPLYRLTEAKETNNGNQTWKQNFTHDRYGNRLTHARFVGTTAYTQTNSTHPAIDTATNRFQSGQGYTFDKNGNVTIDAEGRQFMFNGDNKQTEVKDALNNPIGQYYYDGEGKRVKKVTATETTVFVYSNGKLIAEYSTATPPQNPTTRYTVTDQLGSPRVIVNALGQIESRRDFLPFGEEADVDGTYRTTNQKYGTNGNVRQEFTGYQKDEETGLDFAEARMYENRYGRFTAVDPLLASGNSANPQTFNRYVYVGNDPVNISDPTGLDWYSRLNEASNRTEYLWSEKDPGGRWGAVDFGSFTANALRIDNVCENGGCNGTVYIYKAGGADRGERIEEAAKLMEESFVPRRWQNLPVFAEQARSGFRGGRETITIDGETDYGSYLDGLDSGKLYALFGAAQYASLGGFRSPPSIAGSSSIGTSTGSFAERMFQSPSFGVNSNLFGNSAFNSSNTPGSLNQRGSLFKVGWSSVSAPQTFSGHNSLTANPIFGNNGGMQFRVAFGRNPTNPNQGLGHVFAPNTFVPNSFSNPFVYRPGRR